jgi:tetratricopeptide (TPR) repeat protein
MLLVLALILVTTAVVFSPSFCNDFLNWDDPANVTQNLHIRDLTWGNLEVYFTTPLLGMYSPLVYLSYAIDFRIGGLDPTVYHSTNLLLHLLNVCLVFLIVSRLSSSVATSGIVTALFAVHPMNVAAVAPVSVRSSLLFSCLYLAAYLAYLRYLDTDERRSRWLSLVLFVSSALAKSAAVVFSLLIVLTDHYRGKLISWKRLLEKWPFFLVSLVFGVMTFVFREDTAAMAAAPQFPLWERLLLASYTVVLFVFRLIVPAGLSPFYPYPEKIGGHLPLVVYVAPALIVAVVYLAARLKAGRNLVLFGGLFFLIHVLLVVKLIPLGSEWTADRYVYLSSIGVFFVAAEGCRRLGDRARKGAVAVAVVLVGICAVLSYQRNGAWKDNMSFYGDIIGKYPNAAVAYCNRAAARLRESADAAGALADCDNAIRLDPTYADAYFNRATAKVILRKYQEALDDSNSAIRLNPRRSEFFQVRADTRLRLRDYGGAIVDSEKAMDLNPHGADVYMAYQSRGVARISLRDGAGAMEDFNKAIELNPRVAAAYQNRANARVLLGDGRAAMADYDKAVEVDPSFGTAYYYRGLLREGAGDREGSCADFRKALQLKVDAADALVKQGCR